MNVTRSHFCLTLYKTCSSKVNVPVPLSSSCCSGGMCDGHNQESCTEEPARPEGFQLENRCKMGRLAAYTAGTWLVFFLFPFFHQQGGQMEGNFKLLSSSSSWHKDLLVRGQPALALRPQPRGRGHLS